MPSARHPENPSPTPAHESRTPGPAHPHAAHPHAAHPASAHPTTAHHDPLHHPGAEHPSAADEEGRRLDLVRRLLFSPLVRLAISLGLGVVTGLLTALVLPAAMASLIGIDVGTLIFIVAGAIVLWPMDADQTRRSARTEDLRPAADEVAVVIGLVVSLAGLVALQIMGGQNADNLSALLALLGVFLTWGALHVLYAVRYAYMFYDEHAPGGIDFNSSNPPCYQDFFYVSFAIGMTYGVTDSSVSTTALRSVVLRQSLLSFVFGTVILATAINVVTGALAG